MKIWPVLFATLLSIDTSAAGDYAQWRGAGRDGVVPDSPPLADSWGRDGPSTVWESEVFPRKSGHGSPVIAGAHAFLYINWPHRRPIVERRISQSVLSRLRWFDPEAMPEPLRDAMEKAHRELPDDLRGRRRSEWIEDWVETNVSADDKRWRGVISRRLKDGPDALPLEVLAKLGGVRDQPFANEAALDAWFVESGIEAKVRQRIAKAIPTDETTARDVLLCVSMNDGRTVWKYSADGHHEDRRGSSTPCVVGGTRVRDGQEREGVEEGRVYFVGTTHAHCVDRESGDLVWKTKLPRSGSPSSFVVAGRRAIAVARHAIAFDTDTGSIVWEQPEATGGDSSPTLWTGGDRPLVLVNGKRQLSALDVGTGDVVWSAEGGGASSPVVSGDIVVVHTNNARVGLVAYRIGPTSVERAWSLPRESRGAATPIVSEGTVFVLGGDEALAVSLEDGAVHWREPARVEISSPLLADGKIVGTAGNGRQLWILDAGTSRSRSSRPASSSSARATSTSCRSARWASRATTTTARASRSSTPRRASSTSSGSSTTSSRPR